MEDSYVEIAPNSVLQKRIGDAGWDIVATSDPRVDYEGKYIEYETDFRFAPSSDTLHAFMIPRSSISNTWLFLSNGIGLIDASFRGAVKARFRYLGDLDNPDFSKIYKKGDKILQAVFFDEKPVSLIETENLKESERGSNAFGSTGK